VEVASQDLAGFVEKVLVAAAPVVIRLAIEPLLAKFELDWNAFLATAAKSASTDEKSTLK
jgi:hypothetical protein